MYYFIKLLHNNLSIFLFRKPLGSRHVIELRPLSHSFWVILL